MKKKCKTCGRNKERKHFRTDLAYADGKRNECKHCETAKTKARKEARKDEYAGMGLMDIFHYENEKAFENRIGY